MLVNDVFNKTKKTLSAAHWVWKRSCNKAARRGIFFKWYCRSWLECIHCERLLIPVVKETYCLNNTDFSAVTRHSSEYRASCSTYYYNASCRAGRNFSWRCHHSVTSNCYKMVSSWIAPSITPSSMHSTDSKLLLFATSVFSSYSSFEDGLDICTVFWWKGILICYKLVCVLFRWRLSHRLQPTCLLPRHSGRTNSVMACKVISYDIKSNLVVIPRTLKWDANYLLHTYVLEKIRTRFQ